MTQKLPSLRQIEHHKHEAVRVYRNNEPDDYPAHWHMSYEIIMPEENTYTVLVEGVTYELYPGDIMIIPSGTVHELFAPPTGWRYFLMADRELLNSIDGMTSAEHCFYPCRHIEYNQNSPMIRRISEAAYCVIHEYFGGGTLSVATINQYMGLLLISAAKLLLNGGDDAPSDDMRRTQQQILFSDICAYVTAHCSEPLTPDEIAEMSGYSRFHFGRLFARFTGMNFHDYLSLQRLNNAKRLLFNTDLSITEVAMKAGFGSIATFNRVFTGHEKVSPSEYRNMYEPTLRRRLK